MKAEEFLELINKTYFGKVGSSLMCNVNTIIEDNSIIIECDVLINAFFESVFLMCSSFGVGWIIVTKNDKIRLIIDF